MRGLGEPDDERVGGSQMMRGLGEPDDERVGGAR